MPSTPLFISPHNDDEALFGAYTLIREKPLVVLVTDSYIQYERGEGITFEQRQRETLDALRLAGCECAFLNIPDTQLTEENLHYRLSAFSSDIERVFAPTTDSSNEQHNLIGRVARERWPHCMTYPTYTREQLYMTGTMEIVPTDGEIALKNRMLECYRSQIHHPSVRPHFIAVSGKSEWLNPSPHRYVRRTHQGVINASAVLITKEDTYPREVLDSLPEFDEVLIYPKCPNIYSRYSQAQEARNELIYVQDDDCIIGDIPSLYANFNGYLTHNTKTGFLDYYQGTGATLLGWGAFFTKGMINFRRYTERFGYDDDLLSEADRIFTFLNQSHNTLLGNIVDLGRSNGETRMSNQDDHLLRFQRTTQKCLSLAPNSQRLERLEGLITICRGLRMEQRFKNSYILSLITPSLTYEDGNTVRPDAEWLILEEHALAAYYLDKKDEAREYFLRVAE